jgi:hypothetical protein
MAETDTAPGGNKPRQHHALSGGPEKFEKVRRYVRAPRMLLTELANTHNGQPVGVLFHNQSVYVGSAEKELRSLASRLGLE